MQTQAEKGEHQPQGTAGAPSSWKRQEVDCPLELSGGSWPCRDFRLPEWGEDTFLLCEAIKFVVI